MQASITKHVEYLHYYSTIRYFQTKNMHGQEKVSFVRLLTADDLYQLTSNHAMEYSTSRFDGGGQSWL